MEGLKKSFLVKGNSIVGFSDKNFSTLHIGCVIPFAGNTDKIPYGYLLADGASYKVADYPDLYAVIGNTYGGDTENFNVPNLVDKFIEGSTTSGTEKEAGLPNITGGWMPSVPVNYQNYATGAVTAETKSSGLVSSSGTQAAPGAGFKIDASKSSAVYGKSTTVQPPALTMVYIIKAFHTNEGVDSGVSDDVIEYVNDSLVDKADKSYVDDNFATMDKVVKDSRTAVEILYNNNTGAFLKSDMNLTATKSGILKVSFNKKQIGNTFNIYINGIKKYEYPNWWGENIYETAYVPVNNGDKIRISTDVSTGEDWYRIVNVLII